MFTKQMQQQLDSLTACIEKGLSDPQFAALRALQVAKQARGRRMVDVSAVAKLSMRDDEELWDFITAMQVAVDVNRVVLANGSLDAGLVGIFDDSVIVRDWNTGRHFRSKFTRREDGSFEFSEPNEVRQAWLDVQADTQGGAPEGGGGQKAKRVEVETVIVGTAKSKWSGVLGSHFSARRGG